MLIKDQVFWFDVPMKNTFLMEVLKREQHASDEEFCLFLGETLVFGQMVSKVTACHEVDN